MELAGRKLVRMVPPSENWRADPTDLDSFQPMLFTVDLMHPDFEQHPHLDGMLVYEALLEPGDVLFIPEGWGHQALNLEWSLMISSNYIDQHNAPLYLEWMEFDKVCFLPLRVFARVVCQSYRTRAERCRPVRGVHVYHIRCHQAFSWSASQSEQAWQCVSL